MSTECTIKFHQQCYLYLTYNIVIDCGVPLRGNEVVIEPFNDTNFNAVITFHCEESITTPMVAVCDSNGEWVPDPSSFKCIITGTIGT